eukprot:1191640-Pyramimonas_sp.AAC.1
MGKASWLHIGRTGSLPRKQHRKQRFVARASRNRSRQQQGLQEGRLQLEGLRGPSERAKRNRDRYSQTVEQCLADRGVPPAPSSTDPNDTYVE